MVSNLDNPRVWYKIKDPQRCPLRVLFVYGIPQADEYGKELLLWDVWTYKVSIVTHNILEQYEPDFLFYKDNIVECSFEDWSNWFCSVA